MMLLHGNRAQQQAQDFFLAAFPTVTDAQIIACFTGAGIKIRIYVCHIAENIGIFLLCLSVGFQPLNQLLQMDGKSGIVVTGEVVRIKPACGLGWNGTPGRRGRGGMLNPEKGYAILYAKAASE